MPGKGRLQLVWLVLKFTYSIKKLVRCHDQGLSPLGREIFQIARHEVVGAARLGALEKNIVVRIGAGTHFVGGPDLDPHLSDDPKRICDFAFAPLEAGPTDHFLVLRIDLPAHAKPSGGPCDSYQQHLGWQSLGLKQSRNQNIRVDHNPDH